MKNKKLCAAVLAATLSLGFLAELPSTEAMTRAEISQISVNCKGSNFKYWNQSQEQEFHSRGGSHSYL